MLSDEMTTGSVTTSDADKRAYAARSHAWNLKERRFKEAFPDVSVPLVQYSSSSPATVPLLEAKVYGRAMSTGSMPLDPSAMLPRLQSFLRRRWSTMNCRC